ncbi:hypothetical protein NE897_09730 [Yersinia ruckeri]|uniref:MrpH family fimbial adhesin n=1 Tax=Yersinia ruckeri TaxID=29486 RepID=UPI001F39D5DF|nr:hypothetical protein [Yersinia ruckeri]MCW6545960.1 hypothetical protein [Yersinia ruckeri]MCW6573020.1 hypothetical protein [Yersinia ruckeri]UIN01661.1 hypothetical protein LGL91_04655 [Yersinia ruckeri]UZX54481.1 hypothetical protein ND446_11605 [Yersinia ruckeri]
MIRHIAFFFSLLPVFFIGVAYSAVTVDPNTRRLSGSFSAADQPYELTRTNVRLASNNYAMDIVPGHQSSSRCIPATDATVLPPGCIDVMVGYQTQNMVSYSQVATFTNQYVNAGVTLPSTVNLNVDNTLIACHGAVPAIRTIVRKCLSVVIPAAIVEPPCTISTAPITINHGSLNANVVNGNTASNYLSIQCRTGQYLTVTPAATDITLRSDGSLKTKIRVNDSSSANGGSLVYAPAGGYITVKVSSTLNLPYGSVTAGSFNGSTVLTINVI